MECFVDVSIGTMVQDSTVCLVVVFCSGLSVEKRSFLDEAL